ncbi:MAG TPA: ATP-binding protein [Pyrinomonadaceae bacterium]|nr:ATP-binding protein [Pyrinomonadaceae bacterium]
MRLPDFFYSFRVRLLMVLALLLVGTLGVQYFLFRREELRRAAIIAEQEQALAASTALANDSITNPSGEYLWQLDANRPVSFLEEQRGRVMNILVVSEDGRIEDSLDRDYAPATLPDGTPRYLHISEIDLPRLVASDPMTDGLRRMLPDAPATAQPIAGEARAVPIPVRVVRDEGRTVNYIVVVLGAAKTPLNDSWADVLQPLLPTLIVFLLATVGAGFLVWRFTRPVRELSRATERVAAGDFSFEVEGSHRRDEIGALAATFNQMIARLGRMRELEAQVKQAEHSAVVGRLASAIAHEVRNPLNYINLTLDHLRTSLAPEDPQKRAVFGRLADQLKAEVARINTRISEFLKYTRPAPLDMKPLDLGAVVADSLRMVEVQAEESGVRLDVRTQGTIPAVRGDRESLRSVFTNLIINGMQAMEGEGGRLDVVLAADDGAVRVEVRDTGRGIAADDLQHIFEPYYSTKETGTGLGLAIVKKGVDDHGGTISVSSAPGEGTAFTVTLPTVKVTSDK